MLVKLLFTALIILCVLLFLRQRNLRAKAANTNSAESTDSADSASISPRALAYGLIVILAIASLLLAILY